MRFPLTSLLACVAFSSFLAPALHAQAAYFYLGYTPGPSNQGPGFATISGSGTSTSGNHSALDSDDDPIAVDPAQTNYNTVFLHNTSTLALSGGSVVFLGTGDDSRTDITGGQVVFADAFAGAGLSSLVTISSGAVSNFGTAGGGIVNFVGTNLALGTALDPGGLLGPGYDVTGTFAGSSTPFQSLYLAQNEGGTLEFNGVVVQTAAVPEASTTVSFRLLALGLGSVIIAVRKKKAAVFA